jgi:hypothetical protein
MLGEGSVAVTGEDAQESNERGAVAEVREWIVFSVPGGLGFHLKLSISMN